VPNNHSLSAEHRRHDRLLVARFAVGDAAFGQDHEAADLVRRCSECAALAADIKAISSSVAQLPAAPRPRDFRLTAEQAAKLRGSRLDRWLRTISGAGWATVRPVAAAALSIGLVMSVVGVLPMVGAAAPGARDTFAAPVAVGHPSPEGQPSPGQTTDNRTGSDGPAASQGAVIPMQTPEGPAVLPGGQELSQASQPPADMNINGAYVQPTPAVEPQPGESQDLPKSLPGNDSTLRDALLLGGLIVIVLALAVLALLYAARRRYYDPLLR
jgi:hypothetical protein